LVGTEDFSLSSPPPYFFQNVQKEITTRIHISITLEVNAKLNYDKPYALFRPIPRLNKIMNM